MTYALIVIGYTLFILVGGIAIGATVVRDVLDGLWARPRHEPRQELPRAWVESWAHLNAPAIKRRQRIRVIDVG